MKYYNNEETFNLNPSYISEGLQYKNLSSIKPSGWAVVTDRSECTDPSILYFVVNKNKTLTLPTFFANIEVWNEGYSNSSVTAWDRAGVVIDGIEYTTDCSAASSVKETNIDFSLPETEPSVSVIAYWTGAVSMYLGGGLALYDARGRLIWNKYRNSYAYTTSGTAIEVTDDFFWTETGDSWKTAYDKCSYAILQTYITDSAGSACVAAGTKVKTQNGDTNIEDLKIGDIVIDRYGNLVPIIKTYGHYISQVYLVELNNGDIIECSYDHKFLTRKGEVLQAQHLQEDLELMGDLVIKSINKENKEIPVYEIVTTSGTYQLSNGIVCECEVI